MPNFDLHLFKANLQRKYSELIGESPLQEEQLGDGEIQPALLFIKLSLNEFSLQQLSPRIGLLNFHQAVGLHHSIF